MNDIDIDKEIKLMNANFTEAKKLCSTLINNHNGKTSCAAFETGEEKAVILIACQMKSDDGQNIDSKCKINIYGKADAVLVAMKNFCAKIPEELLKDLANSVYYEMLKRTISISETSTSTKH